VALGTPLVRTDTDEPALRELLARGEAGRTAEDVFRPFYPHVASVEGDFVQLEDEGVQLAVLYLPLAATG
jgi:hypothetical protein